MNSKKTNANQYINWMLPLIKTELFQANSKMGSILTINSIFIALFSGIIIAFWSLGVANSIQITLSSILGFIITSQFLSIIIILFSFISKFNPSPKLKDFQNPDITKFNEISNQPFKNFIDNFEINSSLETKMLKQIYNNAIIVNSRYRATKYAIILTFI